MAHDLCRVKGEVAWKGFECTARKKTCLSKTHCKHFAWFCLVSVRQKVLSLPDALHSE